MASDVQQTRWLLFGGAGDAIQMPFLVVLVCWISVIFVSFGLFAPPNGPSSPSCSSVRYRSRLRSFSSWRWAAVRRLLKISSAPLHYALSHLGE